MDWIIVAGLMAISLVLCIGLLHLSGRISMLEKEIEAMKQVKKLGEIELPDVKQYADQIEKNYAALEERLTEYNESYGDPTYTEWIDKEHDSKGVK